MAGFSYVAFDLSTKAVGVAHGNTLTGQPQVTKWALAGQGRPARMLDLLRRCTDLFDGVEPDCVFIETPLDAHVAAKIGATRDTTIGLNGAVVICEVAAESRSIRTRLLDRQDVLHHFVGQRRFTKSEDGKLACIARARALGWCPRGTSDAVWTYDMGDAAALLDYGCALENPKSWMLTEAARPIRGGRLGR